MLPFAGVVRVIAGALRSIMLPAITAVAQLPATSHTIRLFVLALLVSSPSATDVDNENEASLFEARPLPLSLAVQARVTLSGCHWPSAAGHTIVGGVASSGGLLPLTPASTQAWMAVGRFEKRL